MIVPYVEDVGLASITVRKSGSFWSASLVQTYSTDSCWSGRRPRTKTDSSSGPGRAVSRPACRAGARRGGTPAALAAGVRVRGAAYRDEGGKLAVAGDGSRAGNVGGRCLE